MKTSVDCATCQAPIGEPDDALLVADAVPATEHRIVFQDWRIVHRGSCSGATKGVWYPLSRYKGRSGIRTLFHGLGRDGAFWALTVDDIARLEQTLMALYRLDTPIADDASGELGLRSRFAIMQRDGFRCQLCGRTAQDGVKLEVDHKHPRAKGGTNDPSNLWTLCFDCNRGKSITLIGGAA